MLILGVDTTRDALTVVITDGEKTRFIVSEEGNKKHTSLLIPKIEEILTANGLSRPRILTINSPGIQLCISAPIATPKSTYGATFPAMAAV